MADTQIAGGVGERFAAARKAAGLRSQREAAAALGVSRQATISAWETGEVPIPLGTLRLLADFFQNPDEWFRWLREGGEMPAVQRIRSYTAPEPGAPPGEPSPELDRLRALQRRVAGFRMILQGYATAEARPSAAVIADWLELLADLEEARNNHNGQT